MEKLHLMSGQRYKRTNFEEDDNISNGGTPPPVDFHPGVVFKGGLTIWQKKTPMERGLLILLAILALSVIVLASLLAVKQSTINTYQKKEKDVCLTPECVIVTSSLLNSMDSTVDPCKDFYTYACGGWVKTHPIPSGHSRWSTFGVLWQENQVVMRNVIEQPLNATASKAEKKSKLYYESCMDKNKTIEKLGAAPLYQILKNIGCYNFSSKCGGWNPKEWNFQHTVEQIKLLDLSVFFLEWVGVDDKNSSSNIFQVDQGGLGLPNRDYYLNKSIDDDKILSAYLSYMTAVGVLMGGEENETRGQMRDVIEFESQLANLTTPAEERRDEAKLYHKITIAELQKMAPFIDWLHLLNALVSVANITLLPSEKIIVQAPSYLSNISKLVMEMMQTEEGNRTLNNYMVWHVVHISTPYLSKPFRDATKIQTEAISGTTGGEELWRYCITDTDSVLGFALGAMFVREAFHGDSKKKAEKMIAEIKKAFIDNLPSLSWMDPQTRMAAIDKAKSVVDMIGFPEYIMNATKLDKEYSRLEINSSEYYLNNVRNMRFVLLQNMEKLRKKPSKKLWNMTPPTINAYYTPSKNEIIFPAGILQAPFYDTRFPKSLNFGAMGVVMGHELTHGFDDQGSEYDKFGNLRPWWNNQSINRFRVQTLCMENQYSDYTLNDEHVRGRQTLGENIADNGGLKAAFNAYEDWVDTNGQELSLPAINLTHKQLFFLSFAQVWCSTSTKESDHLQIVSDPHTPAKY
ncbi:hypothetical protein ScPMuIL_008543, partial [Solemya velum]